jgi:hypothetical protein
MNKKKYYKKYIRLENETVWPKPDLEDENNFECLEWRLRYSLPSREDLLMAASYLAAYNSLIYTTQKNRNYVCGAIKRMQEQ